MATLDEVREALKEIYDPEIPINIVDMGLVCKVEQQEAGKVLIQYTLTNPACPIGDQLAEQMRTAVARLSGITAVEIQLVWDPPWTKEKMTFEGKLQASMLGIGQ